MNLKKIKILGVFIIFGLCFPLHFLYEWTPNFLTSIISPVNESIFEHMKLISTSFIIYGILEYIIFKNKTKFNNFSLQLFITPIIGIIVYLIIYLPIYNIIGENMFISIGLLFLIIILEEIISYFILRTKPMRYQFTIGIIGIILTYIAFGTLTYNPIKEEIFKDPESNTYGINKTLKNN